MSHVEEFPKPSDLLHPSPSTEPLAPRNTKRDGPILALMGVLIGIMTAGVIYSPTLYRMFCAATGYGGTVREGPIPEAALRRLAAAPPITVRFDTNIAPGLDWDFAPEQKSVVTRVGVPTTVYFYARNRDSHPIVAEARYNVTPGEAGYYFFKTQCFCFTSETLQPGEEARMPVVFYIDPDFVEDAETKSIRTITLSYTFFEQKDAVPGASPNLRVLTDQEKTEQTQGKQQVFQTDVHPSW